MTTWISWPGVVRRPLALVMTLLLFLAAQATAGGLFPKTRGMPEYPQGHFMSQLGVSLELSQSSRDVEEYDDSRARSEGQDTSGTAVIQAAMVDVSYRILPWTSVALKLGFASVDLEDFSTTAYNHSYDLGTAWGFGLCQRLWHDRIYGLSIDTVFEYVQASPDEWDTVTSGTPTAFDPFVETWHLDVLATKEWGRLACYSGIRYSELVLEYEHPSNDYESAIREGGYDALDNWGLFGGATYIVADGVVADAEISLIDAVGIYVSIAYLF